MGREKDIAANFKANVNLFNTNRFRIDCFEGYTEYYTTPKCYMKQFHSLTGRVDRAIRISEREYENAVETAYENHAWGGQRNVDC